MTSSITSLGSSQISSEMQMVEERLQAPITNLQTEVTADKADISAWGAISGAMTSLSGALSGIKNASTLNNRTVNSGKSSVATATATNSAAVGTYNLTSVTLAKSQEIYSALQKSASATLSGGAGSLTVTMQNGQTESVKLGSGSLTLNSLAAAINKQAAGVQANVISTSTGARLVLQGSATGSSQAFSISGTGALAQFSYSSASAGTDVLAQSARDASLTLNGVPITSASNTLASTVQGVTFTLAGSGSTAISVSSSPSTLSGAVSSVASSLNSALSVIAKETKYAPPSSASSASSSSAKSGPLLGNFTATDLSYQLMNAVSAAAASGVSAGAIGLSVSSTGSIIFNSTGFATAYAQNPTAVQNLVNKIYGSVNNITTGAIGSSSGTAKITGSVTAQTTSLQDSVTSLNSQITQLTKQAQAQLTTLSQEYTAAETAATKASISESYLSIFNSNGSGSS